MTTIIQSNGSRWAGEDLATLDDLAKCLTEHTLDPTFEKYGDFINQIRPGDWIRGRRPEGVDPECTFQMFGNFFDVSHVFNIITDDPAVVARFRPLIDANKATPAYKQAKKERAEQARYWRKREREQRKNSRPVRSSR
jgi:hypothetical protein